MRTSKKKVATTSVAGVRREVMNGRSRWAGVLITWMTFWPASLLNSAVRPAVNHPSGSLSAWSANRRCSTRESWEPTENPPLRAAPWSTA